MIKLIKNGLVYAPEYLGKLDILIVNDKIVKMQKQIDVPNIPVEIETIDAEGKLVVPGLIDPHVHIIGGGGEGGFHTRTPEVMLSRLIEAGITTVVGLLGTDGTTRQVESLLAKAKGLENEGITTYIHTGSYEVPSVTITGTVRKDIMLIDKVLGVKIAVSDHRASQATQEELTRLASEARVAGMLSGKPGLVVMHMGDGKDKLNLVKKIVQESPIPIKHFYPTHVARNLELFEDAMEFAKMGGTIDITADDEASRNNKKFKASDAIKKCLENRVPLSNITMSTDGNGSMPRYDSKGNMISLGIGALNSLILELKYLVKTEKLDLSAMLQLITSNTAKVLGLYPVKGCLSENSDADLLVLDNELDIEMVLAKGKKMMENRKVIVRGTFE